jgi:hypothetical protein
MPSYIRLYLVPVNGQPQQVIDVDSTDLVLSDGAFLPVQSAPTVTLVSATFSSEFMPFTYQPIPPGTLNLSNTQQQELRVCWREPVGTDQYPNENLITQTDPSGGVCVCGVTCQGTNLSYVQVQNVASQ